MTNLGKSNGDAGQDRGLTGLHEDVVRRLETVLGAVANRYFLPKLEEQQEAFGKQVDDQARALRILFNKHKERLDSLESDQATQFQQTDNKLGQLASRCDGNQGSLDHLNAEVNRLEALIQQQASAAAATETSIARLEARMVLTRRIGWFFAAALAASFFLILRRP